MPDYNVNLKRSLSQIIGETSYFSQKPPPKPIERLRRNLSTNFNADGFPWFIPRILAEGDYNTSEYASDGSDYPLGDPSDILPVNPEPPVEFYSGISPDYRDHFITCSKTDPESVRKHIEGKPDVVAYLKAVAALKPWKTIAFKNPHKFPWRENDIVKAHAWLRSLRGNLCGGFIFQELPSYAKGEHLNWKLVVGAATEVLEKDESLDLGLDAVLFPYVLGAILCPWYKLGYSGCEGLLITNIRAPVPPQFDVSSMNDDDKTRFFKALYSPYGHPLRISYEELDADLPELFMFRDEFLVDCHHFPASRPPSCEWPEFEPVHEINNTCIEVR